MGYVTSFFKRRDPQLRVEVVDASLGELVEVNKRLFPGANSFGYGNGGSPCISARISGAFGASNT
jgi:hypothetical protein